MLLRCIHRHHYRGLMHLSLREGVMFRGGLSMKRAIFAIWTSLIFLFSLSSAHAKESVLAAAESYYRAGDFAQAEERVEEELRVNPRSVLAHYLLGNILSHQGNLEEARIHYQWVLSSGLADETIRRY